MKSDNQTELKYQKWFEEARQHDEYHIEGAKLQLATLILDRMEELGVNQSQLAERIGVSRQSISKILNGYSNLTLARMVKIARALNCGLQLQFAPNPEQAPSAKRSTNGKMAVHSSRKSKSLSARN